MKLSATDAAALRALIVNDLAAIVRADAELTKLAEGVLDDNAWIVAGFHLHGIYNALESSFDPISRTFENHVKDTSRWHEELLRKMFLDMTPLRPAVLPESVRADLRDLRGFQHVFRHSYDAGLDPVRLLAVWEAWKRSGAETVRAMTEFASRLAAVSVA